MRGQHTTNSVETPGNSDYVLWAYAASRTSIPLMYYFDWAVNTTTTAWSRDRDKENLTP